MELTQTGLPSHVMAFVREAGILRAQPNESLKVVYRSDLSRQSIQIWDLYASTQNGWRLTMELTGPFRLQHNWQQPEACPGDLFAPCLHVKKTAGACYFLEKIPQGKSLAKILETGDMELARQVIRQCCDALRTTEVPSDETSSREEWNAFANYVLTKGNWPKGCEKELSEEVLPALADQLRCPTVGKVWLHGNLCPGNIFFEERASILCLAGSLRGRQSHFHGLDTAHLLAACFPYRLDFLIGEVLPWANPLGWFLCHALMQRCEDSHLAGCGAHWHSLQSHFARLLGKSLPGLHHNWQLPVVHLDHLLWEPGLKTAARIAGWCVDATQPHAQQMTAWSQECLLGVAGRYERNDVHRHFHKAAASRMAGFNFSVPAFPAQARIDLVLHGSEGHLIPVHHFHGNDLAERGPVISGYASWRERWNPDRHGMEETRPGSGICYSVIVPVFDAPFSFLHECLLSIQRQSYASWEAVIVNDGSSQRGGLERCRELIGPDRRFRWFDLPANSGIARATNFGMQNATGDYFVFLDHDDILRPHAFSRITSALVQNPQCRLLYTDEHKMTEDGQPAIPFFKPAFAPEWLRSVMYAGHLVCVEKSLAQSSGGLDAHFDGIQDYEFFLRLTETVSGEQIGHLPEDLYGWRMSSRSSAMHGNIKGDMDNLQVSAVQAHLDRIGQKRQAKALGRHRVECVFQESDPLAVRTLVWGSFHEFVAALQRLRGKDDAVLLILHQSVSSPGSDEVQALARVAALPDSGLVSPTVLNFRGTILASGYTHDGHHLVPIMEGYSASGDGYNGTLLVNREVCFAAPECFLLRGQLLEEILPESPGENLFEWLTRACHQGWSMGRYSRVVSGIKVQSTLAQPLGKNAACVPSFLLHVPDPWWNPHFGPSGDYRLPAKGPSSLTSLRMGLPSTGIATSRGKWIGPALRAAPDTSSHVESSQ